MKVPTAHSILSCAAIVFATHCGTGKDVYQSQTIKFDGQSTAIVSLDCKPVLEYAGYELLVRNVTMRSDREQVLLFRVLKLGMDPPTIRRVRSTISTLKSKIDDACDDDARGVRGCDVHRKQLLEILLKMAGELGGASSVAAVDDALRKATDRVQHLEQVTACR